MCYVLHVGVVPQVELCRVNDTVFLILLRLAAYTVCYLGGKMLLLAICLVEAIMLFPK